MELAEKILSCEEIKPGVYKCRVIEHRGTNLVSFERLGAKHSVLKKSSTELSHGTIHHNSGLAIKNLH